MLCAPAMLVRLLIPLPGLEQEEGKEKPEWEKAAFGILPWMEGDLVLALLLKMVSGNVDPHGAVCVCFCMCERVYV